MERIKTMIQDINPKEFHNEYGYHSIKEEGTGIISHVPAEKDYVLLFQGRTVYLREEEGEFHLPRYDECKKAAKISDNAGAQVALQQLIYLFSIDDRQYFLYPPKEAATPSWEAMVKTLGESGYTFEKIFEIRRKKPSYRVFAASTAYHLYVWYRDNQFCGRCGHATVHDGKERMMRCPHCGNLIFPKIVPAVIVGVTRGNEILLTTYANREYKRYALIAGFTEIGETAEETVAREVMEEVGLPVKNIRYYKSQPWGFECDLLLGFYCEVDESKADADQIRRDEQELASAEWVKREDVPEYPETISLTHEMMMHFKHAGR